MMEVAGAGAAGPGGAAGRHDEIWTRMTFELGPSFKEKVFINIHYFFIGLQV
jgi:hypothetical protein